MVGWQTRKHLKNTLMNITSWTTKMSLLACLSDSTTEKSFQMTLGCLLMRLVVSACTAFATIWKSNRNASVNAFGAVTITIAIVRVCPVHLVNADLELGGHWPSDQDNQPVL